MNTETAPGGRWPLNQANRLELQARLYREPVNRIHHRHPELNILCHYRTAAHRHTDRQTCIKWKQYLRHSLCLLGGDNKVLDTVTSQMKTNPPCCMVQHDNVLHIDVDHTLSSVHMFPGTLAPPRYMAAQNLKNDRITCNINTYIFIHLLNMPYGSSKYIQ